jgi:hypothetical protein
MHNSALRSIITDVNREIAALSPQATTALAASFAELVKLLALGPAPELRQCPTCQRTVMRAATLCGHCWAKLPALAA